MRGRRLVHGAVVRWVAGSPLHPKWAGCCCTSSALLTRRTLSIAHLVRHPPPPPLIEQPWRSFATVLELDALGPLCVDGDGLGWVMTPPSVAGTAGHCLVWDSRTGVCFAWWGACDRARRCVRADRSRSTVDLTDRCLLFACLSCFLAVCITPPGSGDCSDNNHDWYNGHLPPPFDLDYHHHYTTTTTGTTTTTAATTTSTTAVRLTARDFG